MLALHGICHYQKSIEWLACKLPFQCFICEITQDFKVGNLVSLLAMACADMKWQTDLHIWSSAVMALQKAAKCLPCLLVWECQPCCHLCQACHHPTQGLLHGGCIESAYRCPATILSILLLSFTCPQGLGPTPAHGSAQIQDLPRWDPLMHWQHSMLNFCG